MKKRERNIYISNVDVDEAKNKYFSMLNKEVKYEQINVLDSLDRITYEAVYATRSSPHYNASAMDGIQVKAEATYGASEVNPMIMREGEDFEYINTGNPIKKPYDAVIMIEDVIEIDADKIKIILPAYPWQHIRPVGEDIIKSEMIIPSNHKIRPVDVGALISGGIEQIKAYKKPKVGILPTGTEIVENQKELFVGKIIDSNSRVFEGLVAKYGGEAKRYSPVIDDYDKLKFAVSNAVEENDIILINAGSSAGSKDFTVKIIRELGEVIVHGLAIKPCKPTILGFIKNKPVIGLPGYPVSSYLAFDIFVKPLIYRYTGQAEDKSLYTKATISKRLVSSLKSMELIRVTLGYVGEKLVATPLTRGAGVTMSLVKADGLITIPRNSEGVEAGESVSVKLLKPLNNIKNTLTCVGSHDIILDVIADMMDLSSGHVGSMGGIMAMKRGECHIAPIHLMDEETGTYNIPFIKKYFPGKKMCLIKGIKRCQGFMVKKGNPMDIQGYKDLTRKGISIVNRQRGAGTRILLDYNIKKSSIDPDDIIGYNRELSTHMAVAIAVKTGMSSTGLGIMSAAKALDLDFISSAFEEYDFLVPYEYINDNRVVNFIEVLKSKTFQDRVISLGGYEIENPGQIIYIGGQYGR